MSAKVYEAIHAVGQEFSQAGLAKNRRNSSQGYQFRGIDDVMNMLSPLLVRHKLIMVPRCIKRECKEFTTTKGAAMFNVSVEVEYDIISVEDESKITVKAPGEASDSGDKATNKAMSAAYKYAAFQTFCIPVEGTDDADADTPEPVKSTSEGGKQPATTQNAKPGLTRNIADGIINNIIGAMQQKASTYQHPDEIGDAVKVALERVEYTQDQFSRLMQPLRYEWYRMQCALSDNAERDEEIKGWLRDDLVRSQIGTKGADTLLKCLEMSEEESKRELAKLSPDHR